MLNIHSIAFDSQSGRFGYTKEFDIENFRIKHSEDSKGIVIFDFDETLAGYDLDYSKHFFLDVELLALLKELKYDLCIATKKSCSGTEEAMNMLSNHHLLRYFDFVINEPREECTDKKRSMLEKCKDIYDCPEEVPFYFIDDLEENLETGDSLGMITVNPGTEFNIPLVWNKANLGIVVLFLANQAGVQAEVEKKEALDKKVKELFNQAVENDPNFSDLMASAEALFEKVSNENFTQSDLPQEDLNLIKEIDSITCIEANTIDMFIEYKEHITKNLEYQAGFRERFISNLEKILGRLYKENDLINTRLSELTEEVEVGDETEGEQAGYEALKMC